jgi:Flp pilus assembly protein TadD
LSHAEREFRATVNLWPADVEARFNLGIALDSLGQTGQAIAELSEAVRIKPEFPEARQALAALMARKK